MDLHGRPTPCNRERVSASYHWRFLGLIAAPPRLHGLGSAFSFRGAAAIVRFGWGVSNYPRRILTTYSPPAPTISTPMATDTGSGSGSHSESAYLLPDHIGQFLWTV